MTSYRPTLRALREESGFTMIIAIGVMFITGLLLVAAFTVANGDVHNSQRDVHNKQAYYEAIAGLQQYEYELQAEPNFWQTCKTVESKLATEEKSGESVAEQANKEKEHVKFVVTPLPANEQAACSTSSPFTTMIETKGRYANTFRVRSTGYGPAESNKAPRASSTVIGTFGVSGFLDYLWYTDFETEDPGLYEESNPTLAAHCEGKHYLEWKGFYSCPSVEWNGDSIEGPFHTEDYAHITGSSTFGRPNHEPIDPVQMAGTFPSSLSNCTQATFNTATKCAEKSESLPLPAEDTSLKFYLEGSGTYEGETWLQLEGTKMTVKKYNKEGVLETKTGVSMPTNGLIYVATSKEGTCPPGVFSVEESDNSTEEKNARYCGTVYVSGSYEKSLTIASEKDVIVNGNVYPKGTTLGNMPASAYVLGLIANNYVRVYHPCASGKNTSSWSNPYVYAAILATKHSWIVDNSSCGSLQGELNIVGALAQNYRGVVYRSNNGNAHGYEKHYVYDERLATDEPPYFLAPLKAGWKIIREISQKPG